MSAPLLVTGLLALLGLAAAIGPRRLPRQVDQLDQYRLDQALRSSRRSWTLLFPVCLGVICVVHTGTTLALGRGTWPLWLLACATAAAVVAVHRRTRPRVEQVLESAGARGPDATQVEHDRRVGRWVFCGAGLYTVGTCLRVVSRLETLSRFDAVGGVVVAMSLLVFLVAGWRVLRGPEPTPIVLWHRDG